MIATTHSLVMTRERWESIAETLDAYATRVGPRHLSGGLVAELRALGSAAFKYQAENREINAQLDAAVVRAVAAERALARLLPVAREVAEWDGELLPGIVDLPEVAIDVANMQRALDEYDLQVRT